MALKHVRQKKTLCLFYGFFLSFTLALIPKASCQQDDEVPMVSIQMLDGTVSRVPAIRRTEQQWKDLLTKEQFYVMREKGTERPFTGKLLYEKRQGVFRCAACGTPLFSSDTKYNSKTGWPSFWEPVSEKNVQLKEDNTFFMKRTEVLCARCGAHLGHVFDDGPPPTGKRYCINAAALDFLPQGDRTKGPDNS